MAACRLIPGVINALRTTSGLGRSSSSFISAVETSANLWVSGTRALANWGQLDAAIVHTNTSSLSPSHRTRQTLPPALSAYPETSKAAGPLTIKYPFPITFYEDRTVLVRSLVAEQPKGVHLLPGTIYNVPVRLDILHRCVRYLRSLWQRGTHKAKSRAEVSGGGRKPRPQKGTGRSRQGSIRSPLWRGGGVSHGPIPRSHAHKLHVATRLLGMKCALSAKLNERRLIVMETLLPPVPSPSGDGFITAPAPTQKLNRRRQAVAPLAPKTRHMIAALSTALEGVLARSVLLVDCGPDTADGGSLLRRAAGNIPWADIMAASELTVYHLLKYHAIVISQPALEQLTNRLAGPAYIRRPLRHMWWLQQQQAFKEAQTKLRNASL